MPSETATPDRNIAIEPCRLSFSYDDLAPHISRSALKAHYDIYLSHLGNTEELIAGTELEDASLETIVKRAATARKRRLRFEAGTAWNHAFFWQCLSPRGFKAPDAILNDALCRSFGSFGEFRFRFVKVGSAHVGAGWLWLTWQSQKGLELRTTANGDPVWLDQNCTPLLVCDLWEHGYYPEHGADRASWLEAFIDRCVNWDIAGSQLAALMNDQPVWHHPK